MPARCCVQQDCVRCDTKEPRWRRTTGAEGCNGSIGRPDGPLRDPIQWPCAMATGMRGTGKPFWLSTSTIVRLVSKYTCQ